MKIKLTEQWSDYGIGTVLDPQEDIARKLIAAGYATAVTGPRRKAAGRVETAEAPEDGEQAVSRPTRAKRKRKGGKGGR